MMSSLVFWMLLKATVLKLLNILMFKLCQYFWVFLQAEKMHIHPFLGKETVSQDSFMGFF